jgi:lipopolysaccharide export system permease protein
VSKSGHFSIGSFYVLGAAFKPMRNTFFYVILLLEIVRLKLVWNLAIHQPHPATTVLKYLGQWLPFYMAMALQISLAVGLMFGLAKIIRSRELDALQALGYSWLQLLTPIFTLTFIIMLSVFLIVGWVQPLALYYSKVFVHDIEKTSALMTDGRDLFTVDGRKTILLDNISRDGKLFSRVFIYETYPDAKSVTTAGSDGKLIGSGELASQSYDVHSVDVMEVLYNPASQIPKSYTMTHAYDVQGPLNEVGANLFRTRGASEYEWTMSELLFDKSDKLPPIELSKRSAELNYRLAQLLFILLMPFIVVVVIVEPRRNPGPLRFLIGLLIVLGFNQYLSMATSFSRVDYLSPGMTLWFPLLLLGLFFVIQFWRLTSKPSFMTAR